MVWGSGAREARVCAGSGRDPKGALRPGRPGAWTLGIARTPRHARAHTPHDGHPETRAHGRQRPDALRQGHTDAGPPRHGGTRLPPPRDPQGDTHPRRIRARYLHVVDDGLEEPAQGAALLLRRLHARAGRRRRQGAGTRAAAAVAPRPGRACRLRAALSGRPRRARGWRAAAGRRGPCRGGAGGRRGGRGAGGGRRSLGAGTGAAAVTRVRRPGRHVGAGGGPRGGVCGEAGRAPAHSPPGARALKSEPGCGRSSQSRPGGRRRRRGGGAAWLPRGGGAGGWVPPREGAHHHPPAFGLGLSGSPRVFRRREQAEILGHILCGGPTHHT